MKRIITNPLAVITLICAMAATAAAQTPAAQTSMKKMIIAVAALASLTTCRRRPRQRLVQCGVEHR